MNILLYEHLAAGGGLEDGLSSELMDEGVAMLKAALTNFSAVTDGRVFAIVDRSLVERFTDFPEIKLVAGDNRTNFQNALRDCDAALIIAPETGGVLEELTGILVSQGKINLGSSPEAISITGDKLAFASRMKRSRISHPATFAILDGYNPEKVFEKKWVSKPVDGAGSEDVVIHGAGAHIRFNAGAGLLAQEYIEGETMSLCVVSGEKESVILSVNRQTFDTGSDLKYLGGVITDNEPDERLKDMVARIVQKIPGLRGFWGLDYILSGSGPVVIEVNPRLTSSYCALGEALGINPARIILASTMGGALPDSFDRKEVEFTQNGARI